jgi:hypothetical protein
VAAAAIEERPAITGGVDTHSEVHVAAALDYHPGVGGQDQPVTAAPAEHGDGRLVGDPAEASMRPPVTDYRYSGLSKSKRHPASHSERWLP